MLFDPGTRVRIEPSAVAIVYTDVPDEWETDDEGFATYAEAHTLLTVQKFEGPLDALVVEIDHRRDKRDPKTTTIVVDLQTGRRHIFTKASRETS